MVKLYILFVFSLTGTIFEANPVSLSGHLARLPTGPSPRTLVRLLFTYHPDLEFEDLQAEKF